MVFMRQEGIVIAAILNIVINDPRLTKVKFDLVLGFAKHQTNLHV